MSQYLIQPDLNSFSILNYLLVFYGSCLEMILQASGSLLEFYILLKHVLIGVLIMMVENGNRVPQNLS